jgi:hypothetical protein
MKVKVFISYHILLYPLPPHYLISNLISPFQKRIAISEKENEHFKQELGEYKLANEQLKKNNEFFEAELLRNKTTIGGTFKFIFLTFYLIKKKIFLY